MKNYRQVKQEIEKRVSDFPIAFAFSNKQLEEGLKKLGAESTDEVCSIGAGGFILKKDAKAFHKMLKKNDKQLSKALKNDDFLEEALRYELDNHEWRITYDYGPALHALGLSGSDKRVKAALKKITGY